MNFHSCIFYGPSQNNHLDVCHKTLCSWPWNDHSEKKRAEVFPEASDIQLAVGISSSELGRLRDGFVKGRSWSVLGGKVTPDFTWKISVAFLDIFCLGLGELLVMIGIFWLPKIMPFPNDYLWNMIILRLGGSLLRDWPRFTPNFGEMIPKLTCAYFSTWVALPQPPGRNEFTGWLLADSLLRTIGNRAGMGMMEWQDLFRVNPSREYLELGWCILLHNLSKNPLAGRVLYSYICLFFC